MDHGRATIEIKSNSRFALLASMEIQTAHEIYGDLRRFTVI